MWMKFLYFLGWLMKRFPLLLYSPAHAVTVPAGRYYRRTQQQYSAGGNDDAYNLTVGETEDCDGGWRWGRRVTIGASNNNMTITPPRLKDRPHCRQLDGNRQRQLDRGVGGGAEDDERQRMKIYEYGR